MGGTKGRDGMTEEITKGGRGKWVDWREGYRGMKG